MSDLIKKVEHNRAHRKLPYSSMINGPNHRDAKRWCELMYGQHWSILNNREGRWNMVWSGEMDTFKFQFASERDLMWFNITWSS